MNKIDWALLQRQAPIGLVLFSVAIFQKLIKGIWPFLLIIFFRGGDENKDKLYFWASILGIVFIVVNAALSYWFFKFQITKQAFVVRKGYLKKVRLSVPLDRIQTINIKQNIIQKLLNVVSLEIDTAGAQETEIKLIAIKKEVAEALKKEFQKSIDNNNKLRKEPIDEVSEENKPKVVLNLSMKDLIKVSLSENHIRSLFIVVGLVFGLYYQVKEVFENEAEQFAQASYQTLEEMNYELYYWLGGFVLIFSVLISFVKIVLRFYKLKLTKVKEAFKIHFGLFSTKEVNVPMNKIQFISWHQNPIRQLLNYQTLKIKQAVSGEKIKKKQSIEIPACGLSHQQEIENEIFGEKDMAFSEVFKTAAFYYIKSLLFWLILIVLPSLFFLWETPEYQISMPIFVACLFGYYYLAYRKRQFRISESILEISKGQVSKTIFRIQNYKIQSVRFRQSIFAKRRALADIVIYTAAGETIKIPYIPEKIAVDLYHFLLYKIETTEKPWM